MALAKWTLTEEEQTKYMEALASELAPLRAKAGISQIDLCNLIGISRQTYSGVEGRKRPMTWPTYLSLILFFDHNLETREMLRNLPAYPRDLFLRLNDGQSPDEEVLEKDMGDLGEIWKELDEQAKHSLKTMLLVEYARCKKIPGEVVVKAFDGITIASSTPDEAVELALKNIKKRGHESTGR